MTAPLWLIVVISALTDFFIVSGSGLGVAMVGKGGAEMPGGPEILLSTILGVVAMMKEIRSQMKLPHIDTPPTLGAKP